MSCVLNIKSGWKIGVMYKSILCESVFSFLIFITKLALFKECFKKMFGHEQSFNTSLEY